MPFGTRGRFDLLWLCSGAGKEFFVVNLLVRIHLIIDMIWWTGLTPWELDFSFQGRLISTFLLFRCSHPDLVPVNARFYLARCPSEIFLVQNRVC